MPKGTETYTCAECGKTFTVPASQNWGYIVRTSNYKAYTCSYSCYSKYDNQAQQRNKKGY